MRRRPVERKGDRRGRWIEGENTYRIDYICI